MTAYTKKDLERAQAWWSSATYGVALGDVAELIATIRRETLAPFWCRDCKRSANDCECWHPILWNHPR